jgi:hypothetical protein
MENIIDQVEVPENTVCAISWDDSYKESAKELFENLNGKTKRNWFVDHAYYCLPLVIGNQHGFIYKAAYDFQVIWDGTMSPQGVKVFNEGKQPVYQTIESHFGMGTVTVNVPYTIRTPKGVNLLVMNPPNFYIDGIVHMSACVEADNLRRNFTFNLKITRPNHLIEIKKDTPIGYFLPYPRYFIDNYQIKFDEEILSKEIIENERHVGCLFGKERSEVDIHNKRQIGKRYMNGIDIFGNKFKEHQKKLK